MRKMFASMSKVLMVAAIAFGSVGLVATPGCCSRSCCKKDCSDKQGCKMGCAKPCCKKADADKAPATK